MLGELQRIERIFVRLYERKYSMRCLFRAYRYVTKPNIVLNILVSLPGKLAALCFNCKRAFFSCSVRLKIHAQSQLSETLFLARIHFYRVLVFESPYSVHFIEIFSRFGCSWSIWFWSQKFGTTPDLCGTDLSSAVSCESPCHVVQQQSSITSFLRSKRIFIDPLRDACITGQFFKSWKPCF